MAEWMLNAHKTEEDPRTVPYQAVEQKILKAAHGSGKFEEFIEYDSENDTYWPTRSFEEILEEQGFIEQYDDGTFWNELTNRMAYRDVVKKVGGEKRLAALPFDERLQQLFAHEAYYNEEFSKHGIERLHVRESKQQLRRPSGKIGCTNEKHNHQRICPSWAELVPIFTQQGQRVITQLPPNSR
jgi:hypothetical protein